MSKKSGLALNNKLIVCERSGTISINIKQRKLQINTIEYPDYSLISAVTSISIRNPGKARL